MIGIFFQEKILKFKILSLNGPVIQCYWFSTNNWFKSDRLGSKCYFLNGSILDRSWFEYQFNPVEYDLKPNINQNCLSYESYAMIEKILKMTTSNYLPVDKVRLLQVDWFWGLQYCGKSFTGTDRCVRCIRPKLPKIYKMAYVPRSWVPWSGNGSVHDL